MTNYSLLLAGLFLPLFPLSMPFNLLYARIHNPLLRAILLLGWPQIGLLIISGFSSELPTWFAIWAIATSVLYAIRALVLRELGLWISFIATSTWSLVWLVMGNEMTISQLQLVSFAISIPLILMSFLVADLERNFGAAYLGLYKGLAKSVPRYTFILVVVVLAIIATPVFPAFFVMLSLVVKLFPVKPVIAFTVGIVWLIWSWSGARLLQGLIIGDEKCAVPDLKQSNTWLYIIVLITLMVAATYWSGEIL